MERSVYEATISENVVAMDALLEEDEFILDRVSLMCFHETPLHITIMRGHVHFAASLLCRRPKLSGEFDALHLLSVHLAAIEGHADLVEQLLDVNRSCWSVRDQDGRTTLHLAAMKGRVDVLNVLIRGCPEAAEERLCRGETSLHLCVWYNQLETLMVLVEASNQCDGAFVDDVGNTILHLAAFLNHFEVVQRRSLPAENFCFSLCVPKDYFLLIVFATISFFASINIVMLGISGLPLKNKVSTWLMTVAMIIAITFTTLTYLYSMLLVTPDHMLGQANKAYTSTFYT
ncbi:putative ankyrin repeat-containing protein [Hibiscus syriacus]|uniref:Ankyrin repeat-containing protein n=1 Tax=Hibiscus syriacus TaxID=106335 RepID=A0A6A2XXT7_HIBSY|nr:putative ankyrin repeat-containing protein [Hibiscus syriacus]